MFVRLYLCDRLYPRRIADEHVAQNLLELINIPLHDNKVFILFSL